MVSHAHCDQQTASSVVRQCSHVRALHTLMLTECHVEIKPHVRDSYEDTLGCQGGRASADVHTPCGDGVSSIPPQGGHSICYLDY